MKRQSGSRLPITGIALLAAALLLVAWVVARNVLERDGRAEIAEMLESRLSVTETALERWRAREISTAQAWASNERVIALSHSLIELGRDRDALLAAPQQAELRAHLAPVLDAYGYEGFFVIAPHGTSVASTRDENTGTANVLLVGQAPTFRVILAGTPRVTRPLFTDVPIENSQGILDAEAPTMFVGAPIFDGDEAIGVLTFRLAPDRTFTETFTTQRWGERGEAFAVDRAGTFLTESRFEDELVGAGVLAPGENHFQAITLEDPGADLRTASGDVLDRSEWVPSAAARSLLAGETGSNSDGYNSYVGRPVVGAWTWAEDLGMGVVVELDAAEATEVMESGIRTLDLFAAVGLATTLLAGYLARRERQIRREAERLNVHLESSQGHLRQANEDLTHFAYLASHDLREPARRQQMLTSLLVELEGDSLTEGMHDQLGLIAYQSRSMLSMIDGFRALTNIVGPGLQRTVVDLHNLVTGLVEELVPESLVPGVVVDVPTEALVYPELVDILYRKLLSNATTYGSLPCDIRLASREEDGVMVYSVSNSVASSTRISERDLLQPFVRGINATGTGLGLSICKRAVEYHRGWIRIDMEDDRIDVRFTLEEQVE